MSSTTTRVLLLALGTIALLVIFMKVILPLVLLYTTGLGIELPIPAALARRYPRASILAFSVGGPCLFVVLLAAMICVIVKRR